MVEYAIVAALVAVVAMTAVQAMGTGIQTAFQNIVGKIQNLGQ
jgi:Flp pilus assembly pilin Flp